MFDLRTRLGREWQGARELSLYVSTKELGESNGSPWWRAAVRTRCDYPATKGLYSDNIIIPCCFDGHLRMWLACQEIVCPAKKRTENAGARSPCLLSKLIQHHIVCLIHIRNSSPLKGLHSLHVLLCCLYRVTSSTLLIHRHGSGISNCVSHETAPNRSPSPITGQSFCLQ